MSIQSNVEWYDKSVKTPYVIELETRIKVLYYRLSTPIIIPTIYCRCGTPVIYEYPCAIVIVWPDCVAHRCQ